ncbi:hypothetical protein [Paenibacillus sp. SI8]|uniref:hypothetical protein n=1 Tax=unclassified Paenibacillus TaxID=185978 RepID=UPI00346792AF
MMVAEIETDQFTLFPEATRREIERAKIILSEYVKMKRALSNFEKNPPITEKQKTYQEIWGKACLVLERAVNQIVDHDIREIIEYRYIKGNSRASTILRFSGWSYCDKTFDRKISEGIVSVANTLLYLE